MRCFMKDNKFNIIKVELKLKVGVMDNKGVVIPFDVNKCKHWGKLETNEIEKDK